MIICEHCGFHNHDGREFCENPSCSKFLGFKSQHVSDPTPASPPPPPPPPGPSPPSPDDSRPGFVQRVKDVISGDPRRPDDVLPPSTAAPPPPPPPPLPPPLPPPRPPVGLDQRRPDEVVEPRRVRPVEVPVAPPPGSVFCGNCGTGNEPGRTYCRTCAEPLMPTMTQPTTRVPWWRRWFGRRPRGATAAGHRPSSRRRFPVGKLIAGLLVLGVLAATFGPWKNPLRSAKDSVYEEVMDLNQDYTPVRPTKVEASSAGELADMTIDAANNTWWSEAVPGLGEGQALLYSFGVPVDLARIGITTGTDDAKAPRPAEIELKFSDGSTKVVDLDDTHEFQSFELDAKQVSQVQLTIVRVHSGSTGDATSIAEVEFFKKQ